MLDIRFIKNNLEVVKQNIKNRFTKADAEKALSLYEEKNELQVKLDDARKARNDNASKMKQKLEQDERNKLIEEGKELKNKIAELEASQEDVAKKYLEELSTIPNMTHPTTPIGATEDDSKVIKTVGEITKFKFTPKDHVTLGKELDLIDFENAAKVSGQKFYYLKNEAAMLEIALVQFAMTTLVKRGFTPFITPDLARDKVLEGIGFNPRGEETNVYSINNSDLCLVGTAEITLGGFYSDTIIPEEKLPVKMVGFSHCFRTEAGAAGKEQRGLYRVHQFSKVEMFAIVKETEADATLEELRSIEEELYTKLEIPFRVLDIASGDLGAPAYKKYDIEAWMPAKDSYGEITSTSNCTDYQSRRLNIKYKDKEGNNKFAYMLNGTAVAVPRVIISILENFQNEDGSVRIPKALIPFTGFDIINKKA